MNQMARELGLSPSSRTNITTIEPAKAENKFSLLEKKYRLRPLGAA